MTLQGVAAVLHKPVEGKPLQFGEPSKFPFLEDTPVIFQTKKVGHVQALWVEGDRVHWIGRLDPPPPLTWDADPEPSLRVPIPPPEPGVSVWIDGGWLVGVPAVAQASTERDGDCMVLVDWVVTRMELMRPTSAPWPGLTLNVR